jgi:L-asparaginase/Glu-tRNA(Gln) amidotransferase subunit D
VDAEAKERLTNHLVNLCLQLGINGVVMNYMGAGHHEVDVMIACQKLPVAE